MRTLEALRICMSAAREKGHSLSDMPDCAEYFTAATTCQKFADELPALIGAIAYAYKIVYEREPPTPTDYGPDQDACSTINRFFHMFAPLSQDEASERGYRIKYAKPSAHAEGKGTK